MHSFITEVISAFQDNKLPIEPFFLLFFFSFVLLKEYSEISFHSEVSKQLKNYLDKSSNV